MYYPDPVDAIGKLARHVRRGGLIIFREFDMENARSFPTAPTCGLDEADFKRNEYANSGRAGIVFGVSGSGVAWT